MLPKPLRQPAPGLRPDPRPLSLALMLMLPPLGAQAQSAADLLKEIEGMKSRIQQLEQQLRNQQREVEQVKRAAPVAAPAAPAVDPAEFNRIAVKTEAMEDSLYAQGLRGLTIKGAVDPTYIHNRALGESSFVFLNDFDAGNGLTGSTPYSYDNSYFGMAVLDITKETDSGMKFRLTLAPAKSTASGYAARNIVHEASAFIPLTDLQTKLFVGHIPDWTGYELFLPTDTKFITRNLGFDFTVPTFYTGAGLELLRGKWLMKGMLANMNNVRRGSNQDSPVFTYRIDYAKGEFQGFGVSGQNGQAYSLSTGQQERFDQIVGDAYFIRGPLTVQGQLGFGKQKNSAVNGRTAMWTSAGVLAGYKLTPRFELLARGDYLDNSKNGGNTINVAAAGCGAEFGGDPTRTYPTASCAEGRNGFGPGMVFDDALGYWVGGDQDKGPKRYALSLGANYLFSENVLFKIEYRYDWANQRTFYYVDSGDWRKNNSIFGVSTVVKF